MELTPTIAVRQYTYNRAATAASEAAGDVANRLGTAAQTFADTMRHSEETALDAMTGSADPHALVQALAQTELAIETAVTIRNKVVEAYQEILRMPV